MNRPDDDLYIDANGVLVERRRVGGQEVLVHYDDLPDQDVTVHKGIPVTTPLRTVIDVAPDVDPDHLRRIVADCLRRGLFTEEQAWARIREPDMRSRTGALLLRQVLLERQQRFGDG